MLKRNGYVIALAFSLVACAAGDVLTRQEIEIQNRASQVVADVLFDSDLDEAVSYNIRKDGYVVIRFANTVPQQQYTSVVDQLRSSADINGVQAEQGGVEICPLQ